MHITILLCDQFSHSNTYRYGEIADIDLPRDKATGKKRGFAFLMYEDQRSTVLAVDNLNGIDLAGRVIRVDHVQNYKQKELVDGKWVDRETERLNARPELLGTCSVFFMIMLFITIASSEGDKGEESDESANTANSIDQEDPMRDYLIEQRRESKKKSKSTKHADETPEERKARKERKREKKLLKVARHKETGRITDRGHHSSRDGDRQTKSRSGPRSYSPHSRGGEQIDGSREPGRRSPRRSRSPNRRDRDDRRDDARRREDDRGGDDSRRKRD